MNKACHKGITIVLKWCGFKIAEQMMAFFYIMLQVYFFSIPKLRLIFFLYTYRVNKDVKLSRIEKNK